MSSRIPLEPYRTRQLQRLSDVLDELQLENEGSLTILVVGKGSVGKSSTVNSILEMDSDTDRVLQMEEPFPMTYIHPLATSVHLAVIDTPGLVQGGRINGHALEMIKMYVMDKTIDVLLYVDRLDTYRVDTLDRQVIEALTDTLGKGIWRRSLIVLTHAEFPPPYILPYDDYCAKRSEEILNVVRLGARIKIQEFQESAIPVVLIEHVVQCDTNSYGEKILRGGVPMIPNLLKVITDVILNGSEPITVVDNNLIRRPNTNAKWKFKWKFLIPVILAFPFFLVKHFFQRSIKNDIANKSKPLW